VTVVSAVGHWNDASSDDSWDTLFLAGQFMPGVAKVDVSVKSELDIKKPKGGKGATITDNGDPPCTLKIMLQLTTQSELNALAQMLPLLRPKAKNSVRPPVEIQHPNANFWGITSIIIESIDSPQPSAVDGWTISMSAVQWMPGPKSVAKKAAAPKRPQSDEEAWAQYRTADDKANGTKPSDSGQPGAGLGPFYR
jgi:hypothetical protein